jgi:hypothetical protein
MRLRHPVMERLEAVGYDPHAVPVEEQGAGESQGLRRHRIPSGVQRHVAGDAEDDWEAERELRRGDLQRAQAGQLLGPPESGQDPGRAGGALGVDLDQPLPQLLLEIGVVEEAAVFEEAAFDPAHQVFDRPFLFRGMGPADSNAEPQIEGDPRENRVPLGDLAILPPLQRHRLGPVEHGEQRDPAQGGEVLHQGPSQGLDLLIGNQRDLDPAGVLEPGGEEVHPPGRPVEKPNHDLAEVVLSELAGQPFEADDRPRVGRPQLPDQGVERALATVISGELGPAQELDAEQARLLDEPGRHPGPVGLGLRRPTDPRAPGRGLQAEDRHARLSDDALHASRPDGDRCAISSSVCPAPRST